MGLGTVGSGFYSIYNKNKLSVDSKIVKILVRDLSKYHAYDCKSILTNNITDVYKSNPDIVIEAMGGVGDAYEIIKTFLEKGVHIITSNKDLIAKYGKELSELAKKNNCKILIEGTVCGAIPIINTLSTTLKYNKISSVKGILNGTSNYIMTLMEDGITYDEALKKAKDNGFAEANPDSDVKGYDAARKLSILINIIFKKNIDWEQIPIEDLFSVPEEDFLIAKKFDYKIKYIAEAREVNNQIFAYVKPVFVSKNNVFSTINSVYNGVEIEGDYVDNMTLIGKGAGTLPTGNAVFSDFRDLILNKSYTIDLNNEDFNCIRNWEIKSDWIIISEEVEIETNKRENEIYFDMNFLNKKNVRIYKILN